MINVNQWSDQLIEALAKMAEQEGHPDRAAALRAIIAKRERERLEVKAYFATGRWPHG